MFFSLLSMLKIPPPFCEYIFFKIKLNILIPFKVECKCCGFKAPVSCYNNILLSQSIRLLHVDKFDREDEMGDTNKGSEVEHLCSKCGYLFATLKTMQLRGADEGQTCFYTCCNPKCGNTDKEDG